MFYGQCNTCGERWALGAGSACTCKEEDVMTKDEALKLALEALEEITLAGMSGSGQESEEAMTAWHARQAWKFIGIAARAFDPIKQALAAPVQEPVAHQYQGRDGVWKDFISEKHFKDTLEDGSWPIRALYTTPPAAQRQCNWPTCQSEEYQQLLAEQIKQELVTGAAQPAVPDAIIEAGESPEFRDGWNQCRETMLQMLKARSA